jgi:small subunit ribosomal protein S7
MSRRDSAAKRSVLPDPKFNDKMITKIVNCLMYDGKKSVAEGILYSALDFVAEKMKDDPVKVLKKAITNIKPAIEVRSRRVGGANYQVPMEVRPERRTSLAIRWLIDASRARTDRTMTKKLASEIIDAQDNKGGAIKMRDDVHKMAEANKAFAHYRW